MKNQKLGSIANAFFYLLTAGFLLYGFMFMPAKGEYFLYGLSFILLEFASFWVILPFLVPFPKNKKIGNYAISLLGLIFAIFFVLTSVVQLFAVIYFLITISIKIALFKPGQIEGEATRIINFFLAVLIASGAGNILTGIANSALGTPQNENTTFVAILLSGTFLLFAFFSVYELQFIKKIVQKEIEKFAVQENK